MSLLIGFLTFILVLNCLLLILLVLIQLPKKEAGAGVAFGGGATDALFGAGSGNALTKMTKYAATCFMGLALVLSLLNTHRAKEDNQRLDQELLKKANTPAAAAPGLNQTTPPTLPPATAPASAPATVLEAPAAPAPAPAAAQAPATASELAPAPDATQPVEAPKAETQPPATPAPNTPPPQ